MMQQQQPGGIPTVLEFTVPIPSSSIPDSIALVPLSSIPESTVHVPSSSVLDMPTPAKARSSPIIHATDVPAPNAVVSEVADVLPTPSSWRKRVK